jgi:hypothetical protein
MKRRGFFKTLTVLIAGAPLAPSIMKIPRQLPTVIPAATRNIGQFESFVFPVIKKVYPSMLINDLVKVQPMNVPSGQVFYMDFKHVPRPWYKRIFD